MANIEKEKNKLINLEKNNEEEINMLCMENVKGKKESNIIKRYSKYNLLDELNIKKKTSFKKRQTWDSLSNISKYSSNCNNNIEKKNILISLGNNDFGQLGSEKNKKVGFIDIFSIPINKKKSRNPQNNKKEEKCKKIYKKFNNILNEIKKRNINSMQACDMNKSICCDNFPKQMLTRHSSHLSFFTLKKKKIEEKNYEKHQFDNELYRNIFTRFKDGDVENEVGYNKKISDRCVKKNKKRSNSVSIYRNEKDKNENDKNEGDKNGIDKNEFFLYDSKINYKKKKLTEYDDFLLVNENVGRKKEKEYFDPKEIRCGKFHSGIISKQGFVCLWGLNNYGQLGINPKKSVYTQYKQIGEKNKMRNNWNKYKLVKDDKKNKLGKNKSIFSVFDKKKKYTLWPYIYKLMPLKYFRYKHKVKNISLGSYHTMILTYGGYVFTFGCNKKGQLGLTNRYDKKIKYTSKPFMIPLDDKHFKLNKNNKYKNYQLSTSRKDNIKNVCKKSDRFFFSDNYKYPNISHPIIYIECGAYTSSIIDGNKNLWMWGWNKYGQIDCSYINEKMKKKKKVNENEQLYRSNSNKYVNIPRNIKIKNKNIIQISLGKYHSLCLTEERSVYVWGYLLNKNKKKTEKKTNVKKNGLAKGMKIKICFFEKKNYQYYYKDFIKITKIKCLSNLYISNIVSSSTHIVFVAPINFLNINGLNNNFLYTNKNAGDKYRRNILLKNMRENSKKNILKYFSNYVLTRGGDNIYYVKYTDLYYLININENILSKKNYGNIYYINNKFHLSTPADISQGYYTNKINYNNINMFKNCELFKEIKLNKRKFDIEQTDKENKNFKVDTYDYHINKTNIFFEKIMKPLYIYNENNLGEINNIQIFRVGVGKNFCIFLTSSPISKMLKDKKLDNSIRNSGYIEWENSASTFDIFRNNGSENNLYCIGNSEYGQIILPSHCKQSNVPVHVHKNKLIDKIILKNNNKKYHNFFKIKSKRKNREYNIYESRSMNSWVNDNDQSYKNQSHNLLKMNISYLDRDFSINDKSISSQISKNKFILFSNYSNTQYTEQNNVHNYCLENNLFKDEFENNETYKKWKSKDITIEEMEVNERLNELNRMGRIRKIQRNDCLFNLRKETCQNYDLENVIKLKNNYMENNNLNLTQIKNRNYVNKSFSVFENVLDYKYCLKWKNHYEGFRIYRSVSENYDNNINKRKNMCKKINEIYDQNNSDSSMGLILKDMYNNNPNGISNKSINFDFSEELNKTKESHHGCIFNKLGSFYNKLYEENDINEKNGKRSEIFFLKPEYYNDIQKDSESKSDENDHSLSIYISDEKGDSIKNKRKLSLRNKKENVRNLILKYIDNINDDILKKKNCYDKLNNNKNIKRHFKIFKKRNSCLWNYFRYHKKKNNNNKYNSDHIVNINLLDVACGDYHSLILVEIDILS
ncbi:regulator of chromosome condensation, putative [Plasmodium berghei]|uniref:Regulator of chromosome condensation, putative n=2 Tax=Plasmodium berghei TaxID=5821 RepID=A0A509AIW6_PLABA|nr:regulator of chromosome condensation, putative [Plasmodium berghei ANKA]CXI27140.1 regulator of chromosome condensation, putative [Plasmodium berghei]SCM20560.1 regulator of chromosome condensation, putative [Plasmodium berghei]SCN24142.1 regulator of chromosome condensation, putative [Plasmodium berghei]SCO59415.1 regulator of chromosome condensation, putative [Plasmodium berghei]SCO60636.1 regulator of chromosome condensation, putative [Plasmodium berghei]|eukprot:XP_034420951.1 regulator of chromosome condensation, putative [Plasmodium berghei ANKA]